MSKWHGKSEQELARRHELRRETILQAAARCFTRLGYHRTTLDDIARELNVSKAALYYYIKNKEQIYFDCNEIAVDIALEGLSAAEATAGPAAQVLIAALEYYVEHGTDAMKGAVVLYENGTLPDDLHLALVRKRDDYEQRLRALVQRGIDEGVFKPCDVKIVVFGILGAISWVSKWFSDKGERTSEEVAKTLSSYLVNGLRFTEEPNGNRPTRRGSGARSRAAAVR